MFSTLSLFLGYSCLFFLPGYAVTRCRVKSELAASVTLSDIILLSLAVNISITYFGLLSGLGSPLYFVIAAVVFGAVGIFCMIRDAVSGQIKIPLLGTALCFLMGLILFNNIGYPIISWDAIFVWEAMTDALIQGEARDKTASYPHGLGALGATMGTIASALDFNVALRSLTAILPVLAVIGVFHYGADKARIFLTGFTALFIYILVAGMDRISYEYASSFTSDMFLFVATVLCFFSGIRFANRMGQHEGRVWTLMKSPEYILFLASVFVAANAKQTGLSYAVLPGLAALIFPIGKAGFLTRIWHGIVLSVPALFVGLIWYIITVIAQVGAAGGSDPMFLLSGVHQGRSATERLIWAVNQAELLLPMWFWVSTAILAIMALLTRRGWLVIIIISPTLLFYLFVSGYATRNFTGVMGGLFVMAIIGLEYLLLRFLPEKKLDILNISFPVKGRTFLAASLVLVIGGGLAVSGPFNDLLMERYKKGSAEIGFRGINNTLARGLDGISSEKGALATNYAVASRLATLDDYRVVDTVSYKIDRILKAAPSESDTSEDLVLFIIWPDRSPEAFQNYLRCVLKTPGIRDAGTKWHGGSGTQWVLVDLQDSRALQLCEAS